MTRAGVNKYMKVFMEVDYDRDGKITGYQARSLFLSWRLPREIQKQVWDLSDQDNDSMLSLREFCIALYLMQRYSEGQNLPPHFLVMSCLMKLCCLSRAHPILLVYLLVGELILVYLYTSCRHIFRVAKWEVGWLETGQNGLS